MLKIRKGFKVPYPERLSEGYKNTENGFIANVDADKTMSVLEHFIAIHDEPMFFILELPANLEDEKEVRPGVLKDTHRDVYYIDGCTVEQALVILIRVGELLINDGMATFGFGCHQSYDEIMVEKYNTVSIYTRDKDFYDGFFEAHDIKNMESLITAWDTFDMYHPGRSERVDTDGVSVYSIPEIFRDWGIYLAERREE